MAVTWVHPLLNQNAGPGFLWQISFTNTPGPNGHARGELRGASGIDTGVGFQTNGISGTTAAGVLGLVYPGVSPLITTPFPGAAHGQTGTLHVDIFTSGNTVVDSGDLAVVLDFITGMAYLSSIWPGPPGTAGHDPMLDRILADVEAAYSNNP